MKHKRSLQEYEASKCEGILTQWKFYMEQKQKRPEAVILMRQYDTYSVLGDDAARVEPILREVLTHKDAGKMFCYNPSEYEHAEFSFGVHNLDKALPALIRANMQVIISDFDIAFKEWGGWGRADRMIAEAEERRKAERPKVWVQTSLFDVEGFL